MVYELNKLNEEKKDTENEINKKNLLKISLIVRFNGFFNNWSAI